MSDRIQKLKNESRRLPKNPNQNGGSGGPRRISHGIIGVRKPRRSSAKSNTSTGSRSNPFSDLVPHQSRSSISSRQDKTAGAPQLERKVRKSKPATAEQSRDESPMSMSLSRSQSQSINHLLAASIANHGSPSRYNTKQSPELADLQRFPHSKEPAMKQGEHSIERDIPIKLDHNLTAQGRPSISTLEDGFVQQDDEQAMENMAMDKIDRFLESLGSDHSHPPVLPPIVPTTEVKEPSLTAALKNSINTTDISAETRQLITGPSKQPIAKILKTPELDTRSIYSWATTTSAEEDLKSASVASTPSIRPLSIVKSPINTGFIRGQVPAADPDETFRGVKVSWLIEMYHDYMAEKSRRPNDDIQQQGPAEVEKISATSKGLRPLLLPTVVATSEVPSKAVDNDSTKSVQGSSPRRPTMPRGLTFGAPRTPVSNSQKGSNTSSSGPSSKSPPALLRSNTSLPAKAARPSPPAFKRTVTGLTQQDAVEVARSKMNAALNVSSDPFIEQVIEATALLSPTRSTFSHHEGDERAIAKSHVSPVRDTFSSPKAYSPPMSATLPALAHHPEPELPKLRKAEVEKSKRPPKLNLAKADDRKCIVTNNVAFFDPFASATPKPRSPISPTLSEANLRMNRQFLEGINSMDTGLASSLGSRVAAKLSPPLIHGESGLKNMQTTAPSVSTKTSFSDQAVEEAPATPKIEADLPLMLHEDSTSEDDDLLPKMKPRFEGLGVSSKAQKLLGMSEAKKSTKSKTAKADFPMSRPIDVETTKLHGRAISAQIETTKVRPGSRMEKKPVSQASLTHERLPSGNKLLVEPFDEAKFTSQLTKSLAEQSPNPEVVKVQSKTSQRIPAPKTANRESKAEYSMSKPPLENASTGLISIKFGDAVAAASVSQKSPTRPKFATQGSSVYPAARSPPQPTMIAPREQARQHETSQPMKKLSPRIDRQETVANVMQSAPVKAASPPQKQEVKTYGPFANYRINQDSTSTNANQGQASMSPNSTSAQAVSPNAAQPRVKETGFRVSTSRSPPSPQDIQPPKKPEHRKPSVYYDSAGNRKTSRGRQGRLSVIEHAPIDVNAANAESNVHGLGLGMSPTAPSPSHVFEQILHGEQHAGKARPVASRSTTLDRINKSATPTISQAGSSVDSRSQHSLEQSSTLRAPVEPPVKSAVPISYYHPRPEKESLDPFRNLDMKTVVATRKSSHETKPRPATYGYFNKDATKELGRIQSDKSDTSETSAVAETDRNYTTRGLTFAPTTDSLMSPRTQAPRTMSSQARSQAPILQQHQPQPSRKPARPATMMAAREVHEKFDIRRALARSDDGEEDYDSSQARTNNYEAPDEVFGAFANTATQAFSKWFG